MGHGVGFHPTRFARVGRTATGRHLPPQQRAGLSGRKSFAGMPHAHGPQQTVNLSRAYSQELFLNSFGQRRVAPLVMFEPFGQRRLEQFAAQLIAGQPDRLEHRQQHRRVINDFWAGSFAGFASQRTAQQPQRGFAMVTTIKAKLVENTALVPPTGTLITTVDLGEILAFG